MSQNLEVSRDTLSSSCRDALWSVLSKLQKRSSFKNIGTEAVRLSIGRTRVRPYKHITSSHKKHRNGSCKIEHRTLQSAFLQKSILLLILLLGTLSSCSEEHDHKGKTPLVELDGNFLYAEDLQAVLPATLTKDDSLLFAEHYIRDWVEETLLYEKARNNIPDNSEIGQLVDSYRKALIMHTYQQALIHQQLSEELSEVELTEFYKKNQSLFKVERPLMKGLFIKVPLSAPQLANVRRWYRTESQDAVEHLEKYSLQNAVKYEYFYDKWIPVSEVLDMLPLKEDNPYDYLNKNRRVELKDTAFHYFLNVSDYRAVGDQEPYEAAERKVREMLLNMKQVEFMQQVKNDLYERAANRVHYY